MNSASSAPAEPMALSPADLRLMLDVRLIIGAFVAGDTEGVVSRSAPDCAFFIPGSPRQLPWAGRFIGPDFARFHDAIKDTIDIIDLTCPRLELWGDRAVLLMRERSRVRATGRLFDHHLMGVLSFADRRLTAYTEDGDTWALGAAMRGAAHPADPAATPPWVASAGGWGGWSVRGSDEALAGGDAAATAELLRAAAGAELRGEGEALQKRTAPDASVWVSGADPRLPGRGASTGVGALRALSAARAAAWQRELIDVQIDTFGDSGVLRLRERLRGRAGGPAVEVDRSVLASAQGGRVSRWWEWADTAALSVALSGALGGSAAL